LINEDGLRLKVYGNPSKPPLIPLSYGIIAPHYFGPYQSTFGGVFHFIILQCTMFTYYITWPLAIPNIHKRGYPRH
jgi:hypothetical protein